MIFFVKFWNNVNIRFLSHIDRVDLDLLATGRSKIDWVSFEELQTFPSSFFMLETCIYFDICNFFKKKYFLIFRRVNIWHPVSQHRFQHLYFWCLLFFLSTGCSKWWWWQWFDQQWWTFKTFKFIEKDKIRS